MTFALKLPGEVFFGPGERRRAPEIAGRFGRRVLLVTGRQSIDRTGFPDLFDAGTVVRWRVPGEPDVALVDEGARICRESKAEVVVAAGGGSVLDAGKAAAAMATNDGSVLDYLEDVGTGRALRTPPLPVVAVPTRAGSGSEATRNAVIRVPDRAVKRSLRHDSILPRAAIVDPELSGGATREVAASAGLDALTHLIEAYASNGAQPTTDALAVAGLRLAFGALGALAEGRADAASKESMALAGLWGGIAHANAGLGAVHGLVAPLGGRCRIAHGHACACLLSATLAANLRALRAREPGNPALRRYEEVALVLGMPGPERAVERLDRLRRDLGVPGLSAFGFAADQIPAVVKDSRGSSMKCNPIVLTDRELSGILESAI